MSKINGFVGRRNFLKLVGVGTAGLGASAVGSVLWQGESAVAQQPTYTEAKPKPVNPQEALARLLEGNKRFVEGKRLNPNQSKLRLQETSVAQYPFAAILGCADSRVPAEIVFDQGLGDLFVVRVAGNVASQTAIGSLEFATAVLGAQLIVVLGHARCGAVVAATKGDPLPGRIGVFVEEIKPAVERVRNKTGSLEENSIIANVQYQAEKLAESSTIIRGLINEDKVKIVGGRYDLASGKVTLLT
ncbi:carbonic anhydrase [Richelia sinica FACHB-800]|uniref:carbonic anhydrase n=1 Tax=Richelia sinica FACHB-800 TaxID=1357546 RepID=A0A975T5V3_9NOST|nr:carbonic anhydrase [Richelia sinica]MBD2663680.1 twin-arginine translocation signal domain-containing protein [Richelia sinica FACHB-800]QXE22758.1 carbonic anhydrase [Richelia sinica FACHB-800]